MCVTYFAWLHPQLPDLLLLCLFNRDEVLGRPTAASHFWEDAPHILGGRDLVAGGTWMCVSTSGRAAVLTNFRELRDNSRLGAPSRGELPVSFVSSNEPPEDFLDSLRAQSYPGFNLLAADLVRRRMAYLCSKEAEVGPQAVAPGLHGMTNGRIDSHELHWPKVQEGCRRLQQLLDSGAFGPAANGSSSTRGGDGGSSGGSRGCNRSNVNSSIVGQANGSGDGGSNTGGFGGGGNSNAGSGGSGDGSDSVPWDDLFRLLCDDRRLEDDPERLPATGYGPAFEAAVSSIFVQPVETRWGQFGTRSQTVLAVWADGRGELRERYLQQDGSWQQLRHAFRLPPVQQEGGGGGEQWGDGGEQEVQV